MPGTHTSAALLGVAVKVAGLAPPVGGTRVLVARASKARDMWRGGLGRVAGTVKVKGTPDYPVSRRVRLFRDRDGACVGEVWSNATTGAYAFEGVDPNERYTALAYDHVGGFRAVVADNLPTEAM